MEKKTRRGETDKIVLSFNSRDTYIKRAAQRKGWIENIAHGSYLYNVKWEYSDSQDTYKMMKPN